MNKLLDEAIQELREKREQYISAHDADFVADLLKLVDVYYTNEPAAKKTC
ncbi:MAG: hypothetical protein WCV63_08095 [Negativicutes bacterium]|jgi:hypothetical protein